MNEKTFYEKLVCLLEKLQDTFTGDTCAEIGVYDLLNFAENKLEALTYPE